MSKEFKKLSKIMIKTGCPSILEAKMDSVTVKRLMNKSSNSLTPDEFLDAYDEIINGVKKEEQDE